MARVKRQERPVVRAEDVDSLVQQLVRDGRARGRSLRGAIPKRVYMRRPDAAADRSQFDRMVRDLLRDGLEDEVVPAVAPSESFIADSEFQHEKLKKILVSLKLEGLRRVAKGEGIPVSQSLEKLAEKVALKYDWNEQSIARLVLENLVPADDRGFVTRFFPLRDSVDLPYVAGRLSYVAGRYIRVGVAKWFVFDEIKPEADRIVLNGSLRAYVASIDERADEPTINATTSPDTAELIITGSNLLEIRNSKVNAARNAADALRTASHVEPLGRIPFIDMAAPSAGEVHSSALFLLDLLFNRFPFANIGDINLTVTRFRVSETAEVPWNVEVERRPDLRVVQMEGNHILASVPACTLIAVEQRPLTEIAAQVTVRGRDRIIIGRFPMRVSIERDHVAVQTTFGSGNQELSATVHQAVVACVLDEINDGFANEERLFEFVDKIRERASALGSADDDDDDELIT